MAANYLRGPWIQTPRTGDDLPRVPYRVNDAHPIYEDIIAVYGPGYASRDKWANISAGPGEDLGSVSGETPTIEPVRTGGGSALAPHFDNTNNHYRTTAGNSIRQLYAPEMSYAIWWTHDSYSTGGRDEIIRRETSYSLGLDTSGTSFELGWKTTSGSSGKTIPVANTNVQKRPFHFCASRHDSNATGANQYWYFGGDADQSDIETGTVTSDASYRTFIGCYGDSVRKLSREHNGSIIAVAFWSRPLHHAEMQLLWKAPWSTLFWEPNRAFYSFPKAAPADTSLVIADATHAHSADALTLVENKTLSVADATHAHSADALALVQQHQLAVEDSTHAHLADQCNITEASVLVIADSTHAHSADALTLVQQHQLAVADSTHAHSSDQCNVTEASVLVIADATHAHAADSLALVQQHQLAVEDSTHAHLADQADVYVDALEIADAAHAHLADQCNVTEASQLIIADATHAHAADSLALVQAHALAVNDATHAHAVDALDLVQDHALAVNDATHAHSADKCNLFEPTQVITIPDQRLVVVSPAARMVTVQPGERYPKLQIAR